MWFKYVALPFPSGGYVLVGNTYRDFRKRYFGVFTLLFEGMNVGAVIDGIVRDVNAFAGGAEQADDITLLAFKLIERNKTMSAYNKKDIYIKIDGNTEACFDQTKKC